MSSGGVTGLHDRPNTLAPVIVIGRKGSFGTVHWSDLPAFVIDTAYFIDSSHTPHNVRWLYYVLLNADLKSLSRDVGVPGLSRESAYEARVLSAPMLEDQRRIANFLDDQVARIEYAINESLTASSLLRERAKSSLCNALLVTSKKKRVQVRRMIEDEVPGIWGAEPTGDADVRVARVADFDRSAYTVPAIPTYRFVYAQQAKRRLLRRGDVLLEKSGGTPDRPVGVAVLFEDDSRPTVCSNFISRIRPISNIDGRYLALMLAAMYEARWNGGYYTQTTGIQNLDSQAYLRLLVPSRALAEQQAIVTHVDETLRTSNQLDRLFVHQRELLEERKRALITAAVMGDFDVSSAGSRAAAAVTG